jgi:eukaryotic-like serine/threonine-protein kinase
MLLMNPAKVATCELCDVELPADASSCFCIHCVFVRMLEGTDSNAGLMAGAEPRPVARTFEGYQLMEELGRSATAVVFRAREISRDRIVALKVFPGGLLAGDEAMARFQAEAAGIARLDHPNILPIYDLGELAGQPYFTMRFLAGTNLAGRIGEFLSQPKRVAILVERIARAVHFAHGLGVLHSRLGAENILLDEEGEPFVTDFHLSEVGGRALPSDAGSVACLAPEQVREETIDARTDVYGLGTVLFQLLTGELPFQGDNNFELMRAVVEQRPRRLIPANEGLAAISLKCLSKDPDRRYATAEQLAADLADWCSGKAITAAVEDGMPELGPCG